MAPRIAIQPDAVIHPNGERRSSSERWFELAESQDIEAVTVDVFRDDVVSRIAACDAFMWRCPSSAAPRVYARRRRRVHGAAQVVEGHMPYAPTSQSEFQYGCFYAQEFIPDNAFEVSVIVIELTVNYASWVVRACPGHWVLEGEPDSGKLTWMDGGVRAADVIFEDFLVEVSQTQRTGTPVTHVSGPDTQVGIHGPGKNNAMKRDNLASTKMDPSFRWDDGEH